MKCGKCSTENSDTSKFCVRCGSSLNARATPNQSPPISIAKRDESTVVAISTSGGTIMVELFDRQTPITAGNFLLLAESGFYNGLTFHRVVPNFVIQGGDPEGTGGGGPGFTIPDELRRDLKHDRGTLSMAKTAVPDSGGSQFFIIIGGRNAVSHLNMKHTVFGRVLEGMDVALKTRQGDKMLEVSLVSESENAVAAKDAALKARVTS